MNRYVKLRNRWCWHILQMAGLIFFITLVARATPAVVLSTDVGNEIDDQWAIAYLLTSGHFDVKGILSAQAPSLPAPSAHATYKIMIDEVENRLGMIEHPPLLEGSSVPLSDMKSPQESEASRFLIETASRYSKEQRLTVLTIGAATDVASAILQDPSIVDRIQVVAMAFKDLSPEGGKEYNVENDPRAWQVILRSKVPVTIGSGDVCSATLSVSFAKAAALLAHGPIGAWLWQEYQEWYFRFVKPLRVNDFSKPRVIWDIITLAYVEGLATTETVPRPVLHDDLSFEKGSDPESTINWITSVDSKRLWAEFEQKLEWYQSTHAVHREPCRASQ